MQKNEPHPATRGAREIFARWVLDQGGGKLRPYQLAAGSPSSTWLVGAELASLSRVGFLERAHRVRRGEGGWEGRGGPLGLCCPIWSACTYIRMPLVSASEQSEKGASCDERALPAAAPAASFRCASD